MWIQCPLGSPKAAMESTPTAVHCLSQGWYNKGIRYMVQMYENASLKLFDQLCGEFDLPHQKVFQYLQLRHATKSQTRSHTLQYSRSTVVSKLQSSGTKVLFANFTPLFTPHAKFQTLVVVLAKEQWSKDLGPVTEHQWEVMLSELSQISSSPTHTQLFVLQSTYHTPEKLLGIVERIPLS